MSTMRASVGLSISVSDCVCDSDNDTGEGLNADVNFYLIGSHQWKVLPKTVCVMRGWQ